MQDTPQYIIDKQREIFNNKTSSERFSIGAQLIEDGWAIVESDIKHNNPGITYPDLRAAMFRRIYVEHFDAEELNTIAEGIKNYHIAHK